MQLALIVSILFVAGLAEAMAKKLSQNAQMPLFIDCDEDKECVGLNLGCSPFINNGKAACLGGYCNCPYYTKEQNEKAFGIEKNDSVANLYSCKNKYDCFRRKKMHCPPKVRICRSGACICPLHHEDWDWNNIKKEKKEMRLFMECEEHEECEDIDFGCSPFINHGKAGCWGGYCNCPYSTDAANDRAFGKDDGGFRLYSCDDDYDCYKRKRINCPPSQRVCKKHGSKTRGMCYCPVLGKSNTPILKSTLEWIVDKIQSLFLTFCYVTPCSCSCRCREYYPKNLRGTINEMGAMAMKTWKNEAWKYHPGAMAKKTWKNEAWKYHQQFYHCHENEECAEIDMGCPPPFETSCLGGACGCPYYWLINKNNKYDWNPNEMKTPKMTLSTQNTKNATTAEISILTQNTKNATTPKISTLTKNTNNATTQETTVSIQNTNNATTQESTVSTQKTNKTTTLQKMYRCEKDSDCKSVPLGCFPRKNSCSGEYCGCL